MMLARFAVLLAFSGSVWAQGVALVTDLTGKAGALAILSEIAPDAKVRLESGQMAVLYYGSGEEYRLKGPATITFAAAGPRLSDGAQPQATPAAPDKRIDVRPGGVTPAAFAMRAKPSAEVAARMEALRPANNAPFSERVAFAAWLEQMQLKDEAKPYWKALAAERPDSAALKALAAN